MFFDNYMQLCRNKGIAPTKVLKDLNISHSLYTKWQDGGSPTNRTAQKIAEYFGISTDELMNETTKKPTATTSDGLSALDIQLIQALPHMSEQEKLMFLAQVNGVIAARGR